VSPPVENLVSRLHAKRSGEGWKAKCPVHDDRNPSLSIREGSDGCALIKCHAGCQTNDILAAISLKPRDLFVSSKNGSESPKQTLSGKTTEEKAEPINWQQDVDAFKESHLARFSDWRGYSSRFCSWLHNRKLLGLHDGCIALPVEGKDGQIIAAHCRPKSGKWFYEPGVPVQPFIIGNLKTATQVHVFESQWDMFAFMDRTELYQDPTVSFIATRGASHAKVIKGLLREGVSVCAWPQNDAPGEKWLKELAEYADVPIAKAIIPEPHKDMNAWTKAGASAENIYLAFFKNELVELPKLPGLGTLLDKICAFLRQYISFTSDAQPAVVALWIAHTWFVDSFEFTPYLHIFSPTRSCGKSHLLACIAKLARNVLSTVSLTVAALFRTIEQDQPTLLIDEVDNIFSKGNENEELRAILNAGFERGSKVRRCVGPNFDLKDFAVFCPKALAGIGRLPDTVSDRCIPIHLIAKKKSDKVQRFRKREVNVEELAAALEVYAQKPEIVKALCNGRAEVPEISDRQNDIAEGLIVIADLAGGDWPSRGRRSLIELFSAKEEDNTGVQLLVSCRDAFGEGQDRITTKDLLDKLIEEQTGTPWAQWWENDLNKTPPNVRGPAARIARLLKPFGIKADVIKLPDNSTARGYLREDFEDNWNRYCPLPPGKDVTM
jgi:Protein of unknown function (DUF3631)